MKVVTVTNNGKHDEIFKEFRRRRWVPGISFSEIEDGKRLRVD